MLPPSVASNRNRIENLVSSCNLVFQDVDPAIQSIMANHLVILTAGYVETAVIEIVRVYVANHGNNAIQRFISRSISRENSLNCEKISTILNSFDKDWWKVLSDNLKESEKSAVDSIKALRDQIAHGQVNGTGYIVIRNYNNECYRFIEKLAASVV